MRTPLCICNGVIRSGSTWSFNVCRELFAQLAQHLKLPFGSAYLDPVPLEQFITQHWPNRQATTVIKAHDLGTAALAAVRSGNARAVCTFRDPRDCIASDLAFVAYPFEVCVKRLSGTLEPLRIYQSTPHILLVRYEDMMADRQREIRRIATHLGIQIDEKMVQWIDSQTNMQSSEKLCKALKHRPANELMHVADHRVDPNTHLHENHINGGTIGRWKTELTSEQIAYSTEYFAPWLIKLGYETQASIDVILNATTVSAMAEEQAPRYGTFSVGAGFGSKFAGSV